MPESAYTWVPFRDEQLQGHGCWHGGRLRALLLLKNGLLTPQLTWEGASGEREPIFRQSDEAKARRWVEEAHERWAASDVARALEEAK